MAAFNAPPFSDEWVDELVELSSTREPIAGLSGVVRLGDLAVAIVDGQATGVSAETPEVEIPLSKKQVDAWSAGELVLTEAYMKGDLKPVGTSGPLFAGLELLDWVASA